MSGSASDPFFWSDWQGDPCLRMCSFAAQGFWMRLLCVAAESKKKGYVLVNGHAPTNEQLSKITGANIEDVKTWLDELLITGTASKTRHGVIYNRKMVRNAKKRAASSKGGKIGGRVTHEKQTGIFTTQETAQGVTQESPPESHARAPLPSHPVTQKKEEIRNLFLDGKRDGEKYGEGTVTIPDAFDRLARFKAKLASHLGPRGWDIVESAVDRADPHHDANLSLCKQVAKTTMKKGWPRLWFADAPAALESMPRHARAAHVTINPAEKPKYDLRAMAEKRAAQNA